MAPDEPPAPLISVVLPVHDGAATLPAALDSVLGQTETDWELIAVDDGSSDGSAAVLQAYARRDRRVRVVRTMHRGLVPALQTGLAVARGAFIARLDADDVCLPERLARQARFLDAHPEVGLVACRVRIGGAAGAGYARHVAWTNGLVTHEQIALARFVEAPVVHPSVMFRRAALERHGGYREGDFPEDYELWLRWLEAGVRMEKLTEPLLVWTDRPGRLSRRDPRYAVEAFYRVKAPYLARWLARHNPHHPAVTIWGAGRLSRMRTRPLTDNGIRVAAWVDVDPRKIGAVLGGRPVIAPGALPAPGAAFVVTYVASHGAREQIAARLAAAGYLAGRDFLPAA